MGGKAPAAPNPYQTAAAQTQSNEQTAQYQAALNAGLGNISNPYGSNTVQTNAQGTPIGQTQAYLPWVQSLLGLRSGLANDLSQASNNIASNLPSALNLNFGDTVNNAAQAAYGAQTGFLQPQFQLQQKQLNQQLTDRGLPVGSEAWNDATSNLNNSQNLALTQAANNAYGAGLGAQAQGFGQAVTQNQLPFSQLASLSGINPTASILSASPGAANQSPTGVQPTNMSLINQGYQNQLAAQQSNAGQLGAGLLGLGNLALSPSIGAGLGLGSGTSLAGAGLTGLGGLFGGGAAAGTAGGALAGAGGSAAAGFSLADLLPLLAL